MARGSRSKLGTALNRTSASAKKGRCIMSYRSKKEAIAGIRERPHSRNGKDYTIFETFLGYDSERKQKRLSALSKEALKEKIADFYKTLEAGGAVATTFSEYEAADARKALDWLAQKKSSLTLLECAKRATDAKNAAECSTTVSEAYAKFMASQFGKSADYIKTLKNHVGTWVMEFGGDRPLNDITAAEVTTALKKRIIDEKDQGTWKTYNNHLGDIKTFVNWCAKPEQAMLATSPIAGVSKLKIPYRQPKYVKAEDVAKLMRTIAAEKSDKKAATDLADAILSFFCGMRQCEIERVREGDESVVVNTEEKFIRVIKVKGATNGADPRAFTISEQAIAWMRSFDFKDAVRRKNKKFRRHLVLWAKKADVKLPKNAGRHTFITMHAAAYHDQALLTSLVGNTEGVRVKSYNGVEVEKNGKAYFDIKP